ncbi:MAG: potassium channel family protein [Muribaculaceae bacterium]|nr:potassium channel family protein [Muribaculaceae bacterium]
MFRRIQYRIYDLIDKNKKGMWVSRLYDWYMLVMIIASLVPLMFIEDYPIFTIIEGITVSAFIVDYAFRWFTSDILLKRGWMSFLIYPLTPMAIIDLLSILPGFGLINPEFKLLRLTRLLKIVRLLKIFRYSPKIMLFFKVLVKERSVLLSVLVLAVSYILITALVMFNTEPHINPITGEETFHSFFDALYWATVTLTTVGYGDLTPVTGIGRLISMISSLFGVAIIALPSGVITASYMEELKEYKEEQKEKSLKAAEEKDEIKEELGKPTFPVFSSL